jgi:hypothetical protein
VATTPPVFVHCGSPDRLLTAAEFNSHILPFSDAEDTARILQREAAIKVDGVAYEPGKNAGTITMDGSRLVNMWTPTRVGRRKGDAKPFLEFMAHLIPVEKDRSNTLRWVATLIARPGTRMRYGILMISKQQGVGKGTLMEAVLSPLVGRHNVSVPTEKMLTDSDFNSWLVRKRLVLVHEIYAGHAKKAYDNIKSSITQDDVTANEKYLPQYIVRNHTQYVLSSNSFQALRLVKNDRRWFVPGVTETKRDAKYWLDLYAWLIEGGLEVIHEWAYDYVAKHGCVGPGDEAPASAAKERLIQSSRSEGQQLVFDLGAAAMERDEKDEPVVLTDRAVRDWVRQERQLTHNDSTLEGLMTIRTQLNDAGMMEVLQYTRRGARFAVFANQSAIERVNAHVEDERRDVDRWTWADVKDHEKPPETIAKDDETCRREDEVF